MSFYSMEEMACISYNRLRLELSLRSGSKRAAWLHQLISQPTRLFGTTLIGVNIGLVLSSESIRQLFCELGLNPNLSPLIHVPYILIIGELVPMFAARLYPEHIAWLGTPLLRISSVLFSPILFFIDSFFTFMRKMVLPSKNHFSPPHLQREALRELIEEKRCRSGEASVETLIGRVLSLKEQKAHQLMDPLDRLITLHSTVPVGIAPFVSGTTFVLVRNTKGSIIGYVRMWDAASAPKNTLLGSLCRSPTFVNENAVATDLLFRLKRESSDVALVVDAKGEVVGAITLDDLLSELTREIRHEVYHSHVEKTVAADERVDEFLNEHKIITPLAPTKSFGKLMEEMLGRRPTVDDVVSLGPLEIRVKEATFRGAKTVIVKTMY